MTAYHNLVGIMAFSEVGLHIHNRQARAAAVHHTTWLDHNPRLKASWQAIMHIHLGHGLHALQPKGGSVAVQLCMSARQGKVCEHTGHGRCILYDSL